MTSSENQEFQGYLQGPSKFDDLADTGLVWILGFGQEGDRGISLSYVVPFSPPFVRLPSTLGLLQVLLGPHLFSLACGCPYKDCA